MERKDEKVRTIIGGDFNARTGEEGGWIEEEEGKKRKSKDKKVNKDGRKLFRTIEKGGYMIMNGCVKGDEGGKFTYIGRRGKHSDRLILGGRDIMRDIEGMEIGDDGFRSPSSDTKDKGKGKRRKKRRKRADRKGKGRWDKEGREKFKRGMEGEIVKYKGKEEEKKKVEKKIRETMKICDEGKKGKK